MVEQLKQKKPINPFVVGGVIVAIIAVILLIISLKGLFHTNPYEYETVIDNFSDYYKDLPQEEKDLIFYKLYGMIERNLPEGSEIPESGAYVREGTAEYEYCEDKKIYTGKFIVDIPAIERSYHVQFEWSPLDERSGLGGYPVMLTCLPADLKIYDNDSCNHSMGGNFLDWINSYQLDYTVGARTSGIIREVINEVVLVNLDVSEHQVVIDEATIKKLKAEPNYTYAFSFMVDKKQNYNVIVRVDPMYGREYIAVYIEGNGTRRGVVLARDDETEASLVDWLGNLVDDTEVLVDLYSLDNYEMSNNIGE